MTHTRKAAAGRGRDALLKALLLLAIVFSVVLFGGASPQAGRFERTTPTVVTLSRG